MKKALVIAAFVVLIAAVATTSPAAAQDGIEMGITVDNESASDGDRVEVDADEVFANISVESDNTLNFLRSSLHQRTVTLGVPGNTYNTSFILEVRPGSNDYSVVVEDVEGNVARATVDIYKEPTTAVELRNVVERLRDRRDALEEEIDELEERRNELNRTRQELRQELNNTSTDEASRADDGNASEGSQEGPQGLPGFGFVVALVALAALAVYRR